LNAGKPEEAEYLRQQAEAIRREGPADSQLLIRVLLRTGRLAEAQQKLEELAEVESLEPVQTPRSHRETQLLLSIIYAMQGQVARAFQSAVDGTRRGEQLNSPFITAVGYMRQGHAILLQTQPDRFEEARQQYEKAVEISRTLAIPRLRIEAWWGLCQTYGRQGDLAAAGEAAGKGLQIATQVGDEWIASLIRLAMGANHLLAGDFNQAIHWLDQAIRGFQECSDTLGTTVSRLWLCLGWFQEGAMDRVSQSTPELLAGCQHHGYDFLFTCPTLLGPFNERILVPLLILARDQGWQGTYPAKLLNALKLTDIQFHPGYQLRIETLGTYHVWRGDRPIPYKGWRRDKARQLFQLLVTYRDSPLDRDQICEFLWPGTEPKAAQRNFKVALSTLYNVLEPAREAGSESAYIVREGTVYGIRPGADIWLDADDFNVNIEVAEKHIQSDPEHAQTLLNQALQLYQGEYLPDARYETWAAVEREHLSVLFLRAADQSCETGIKEGAFEEVIHLCGRILVQDNCWERAYRYLMLAYDKLGDHGQVARTYQRCVETLQEELEVTPSPDTEELYKQLTGSS
jgi:DNA-binding SARP family transcriptional activator